jgi:hypothetical protein
MLTNKITEEELLFSRKKIQNRYHNTANLIHSLAGHEILTINKLAAKVNEG